MTSLYRSLPASAQAAFSGLDVATRQRELERCVADLPGGFTTKVVKGRTYWYYQLKTQPGKVSQIYLGPDEPPIRELIASHRDGVRLAGAQAIRSMARAAMEYGCTAIPSAHGRVIDRLSDYGFFRAGGMLVGTHAFIAYQNHFGVRWVNGAMTLDLDFAHAGKNLSIAMQSDVRVDTRGALESLQMGFIPVVSQTTYKKPDEPDFDIDFLTSVGRSGDAPVHISALNVTLQPLRFMELSMESPMPATVLLRSGSVAVNVPRPERYALHKLIVSQLRPAEMRHKAVKDIAQAAHLLDYLLTEDADLVADMWHDVLARGKSWESKLTAGFSSLCRAFPDQGFDERLAKAS
ncbi:MAG: nucleotidyltransferase domain-containing protein [Proteobacteria bacterium]|nr:nucleotidyltransferase domain-containing protein [Pseudomonadota bacterium]MBS0492349.1 nucleotidyltransferase domain-containing protein [Pseudomonadota bacterium]